MRKKYTKNIKLEFAYQQLFSNISSVENLSIHDVVILESGDNLPKSKMQEGEIPVYGGGGSTNNKHNIYNLDYKTIGIGRVGARCGCVFDIKSHSWITDNALYVKSHDERFYLSYLKHFLSFSNLNQYANNAMQPVISKTRIKSILIPLIDMEEQVKISVLLDKIESNNDTKIEGFEDILKKMKVVDIWEELQKEVNSQQTLLKKLRQSILQEAIEGKLTASWREENRDIESASVLLEKIKAEKEQLIKEKKIKKQKALKPISESEIPFEIPDGWVWCRLGDLCTYGSSLKVEPNNLDKDTWILDLEDIEKESSRLLQKIRANERKTSSSKSKFYKGNVLYSKLRPYLDKVIVADEDGVCTTEILPLHFYGKINSDYSKYALKRRDFLLYVNQITQGVKMPRLGTENGRKSLYPLPPLQEQKQIVKKIESLFKICDELEEKIGESKKSSEMLMQSVLREAFIG